MNDLLTPEGILNPILTSVKKDHTLMLSIRDNYINIYYRGGNILKLTEQYPGYYLTEFNENYNKFEQIMPELPQSISNQIEATMWSEYFPNLKCIMDEFFSIYPKSEREFQQLVAREKNISSLANFSEYFITDIEYASPGSRVRFDMLGLRWLASQRKSTKHCRPVIMEMKYGDSSINSKRSGVIKHLEDIDAFVSNDKKYLELVHTIENQFDQLDKLGLLYFKKFSDYSSMKIQTTMPEVIIIIANYNPRGASLKQVLSKPEMEYFGNSDKFDLKFFVSSFAGYALHSDCMLGLNEFQELVFSKQ